MPETDHDLLIRIDERVKKLDRCMTNHLSFHEDLTKEDRRFRRSIMLAAGVSFVSAVVAVLTKLL